MTLNPFQGHAPALPTVTRRSLLRASPALMVPLLPAAALAAEDTPVMVLYRQWHALDEAFEGASNDEQDRLYKLMLEVEWRLTRERATCTADLAAKVLILTSIREDYGTIFEPELREQMEALVAGGAA